MEIINFSAYKTYQLEILSKELIYNKVDRLFIPHLRRLNELPGIITQGCCVGHKNHRIKCNRKGIISLALSLKHYEFFKDEIEPIIKKESCVKSVDATIVCARPENTISEPLLAIAIRFKRKMFNEFIKKVVNFIIEELENKEQK